MAGACRYGANLGDSYSLAAANMWGNHVNGCYAANDAGDVWEFYDGDLYQLPPSTGARRNGTRDGETEPYCQAPIDPRTEVWLKYEFTDLAATPPTGACESINIKVGHIQDIQTTYEEMPQIMFEHAQPIDPEDPSKGPLAVLLRTYVALPQEGGEGPSDSK